MKKIFSCALVCVMLLSCLPILVSAEDKLPFELVAPGNVTAVWLEENDSPTTTSIAYSLSNEMTSFFKRMDDAYMTDGGIEAFLSEYDFDSIGITTQVDWAVDDVDDSVSGWHCNEFWNADYGFGYDSEGRIRVGEWDGVDLWVGNATETLNSHWVTRYVSEDALNGNPEEGIPGIKDQMRPDQYEYRYDGDVDGSLFIDYTQHTVYFRMRFVVTTSTDTEEGTRNEYYYSDWSNVACVGKDAEKFEPLTAADLPAPTITDLHMTDKEFNDNPVLAFTLSVPDDLAAKASGVQSAGGGIYIETYARVKGDSEWIEMPNTDWTIRAGEMECALAPLVNDERPEITADTVVELRCRYRCFQLEKDDVFSEYSEIVTFGSDAVTMGVNEPVDDTREPDETVPLAVEPEKEDKCPICGFCPQPLGLCIFIWIAIIALIAVVIIVIVIVSRKKKKDGK